MENLKDSNLPCAPPEGKAQDDAALLSAEGLPEGAKVWRCGQCRTPLMIGVLTRGTDIQFRCRRCKVKQRITFI